MKLARVCSSVAALALLAAAGCNSSLKMTVVDIDNGYAPVAGATVERYRMPHRAGDPWPTTPTETKSTGADGIATFGDNRGRFVVRAPGKASTSFFSTFAPTAVEMGVGSAPAAK